MNGSPISTYRRANTKKYTNATTSNVSFSNSVNGVFKNSTIGDADHGSSKYWAAWKFKDWKKKQLNYDIEELVKNRDMIRSVIWLGCNNHFEVKYFLEHVRQCRLCYNIPPMTASYSIAQRKMSKSPQCSVLNNSKDSKFFIYQKVSSALIFLTIGSDILIEQKHCPASDYST